LSVRLKPKQNPQTIKVSYSIANHHQTQAVRADRPI
jgi:hypothetical protein